MIKLLVYKGKRFKNSLRNFVKYEFSLKTPRREVHCIMPISEVTALTNIEGFEGRKNTVAYLPPKPQSQPSANQSSEAYMSFKGHVIFFPGDIQDFSDIMRKNHACRDFVEWCYETALNIISNKFPNSYIWLISPSKKVYNSICIYKNFVKSESIMGVPSHQQNFYGLTHLNLVLTNSLKRIESDTPVDEIYLNETCPIVLLGFSKGCIVLNQFLYELSAYDPNCEIDSDVSNEEVLKYDKPNKDFVERIKMFMWLDGGHSGEKEVWVTNQSVIAALPKSPLVSPKFRIYTTPYQTRDLHRPWKGESEMQFVRMLTEVGVDVLEKMFFEDQEPTLDMHFKILLEF